MKEPIYPADSCLVKIPQIKSKRYLGLIYTNKQIIRSLTMTIAIEQWEIHLKKSVRKGEYKAYQTEKIERSEAGNVKKVLIEKNTNSSIFLYKVSKKQIDGFDTIFVSATMERRFVEEFKTFIPTIDGLRDYFSQHQIEKLPKSVRKFLLSSRNGKKH